tara:strand:+ start:4217 stop:5665 length:1449 start_codon:yes stop_codon:yes gene_type:complete
MDKSVNKVLELYKNYKNNEFVIDKLNEALCNKLPIEALCWYKQNEKKNTITKTKYISTFMKGKVQYYYISKTDLYIQYDNKNYLQIDEDELLYKILSKITKKKSLLNDKQEIKDIIISKIKKSQIKEGIPESITIQNIINYFYPILFKTKAEAKYFLTILGDNILNKTCKITHILCNNSKIFLNHILFCYKDYFNSDNIISSFKIKKFLNNEVYDNFRLIDFKENINNKVYWKFFVEKNILNIVSVAIHYSQRYENSETFLKDNVDCDVNNILFFENNNRDDIVNMFCNDYLIDISGDSLKDYEIKYLWFKFIENRNIPELFDDYFLQNILTKLFKNKKIVMKDNCILNKTHKNIYIFRKFLDFWNKKIILDIDDEIEISEIFYFFKKYSGIKTTNERELLKIIKMQYPFIPITNNKTIFGYKCNDWDKRKSITKTINSLENKKDISKMDLYKKYCKKVKKNNMIVSKTYFFENIDSILNEN